MEGKVAGGGGKRGAVSFCPSYGQISKVTQRKTQQASRDRVYRSRRAGREER